MKLIGMVDYKISDEKFKIEVIRLLKSIAIKVGENSKEIALLRKDLDKNIKEFKSLKKEIRANSGILDNVNFRVIEMYNRLFDVEKEIKSFVDRFPDLEEEHKRIFSDLLKMADNIDNNPDAKIQLDELDVWLLNLEEKVFV